MARPTTKQELLDAGNEQFNKLWQQIDSMTKETRLGTFNFDDRDKNIRDVLVHLYEWHQLLLNWVESNQKGIEAPFLLEGYNWKTYPAMNVGFWEKHQNTSFQEAKKMLEKSHNQVMTLIEKFSNEELFTKKYFSWTGTTNIGTYFVSSTSSHYVWAMKKIKNHIKTYSS